MSFATLPLPGPPPGYKPPSKIVSSAPSTARAPRPPKDEVLSQKAHGNQVIPKPKMRITSDATKSKKSKHGALGKFGGRLAAVLGLAALGSVSIPAAIGAAIGAGAGSLYDTASMAFSSSDKEVGAGAALGGFAGAVIGGTMGTGAAVAAGAAAGLYLAAPLVGLGIVVAGVAMAFSKG